MSERKYVQIPLETFLKILHAVLFHDITPSEEIELKAELEAKLYRMKAHDEYNPNKK